MVTTKHYEQHKLGFQNQLVCQFSEVEIRRYKNHCLVYFNCFSGRINCLANTQNQKARQSI